VILYASSGNEFAQTAGVEALKTSDLLQRAEPPKNRAWSDIFVIFATYPNCRATHHQGQTTAHSLLGKVAI
jgi:hypothetical protein